MSTENTVEKAVKSVIVGKIEVRFTLEGNLDGVYYEKITGKITLPGDCKVDYERDGNLTHAQFAACLAALPQTRYVEKITRSCARSANGAYVLAERDCKVLPSVLLGMEVFVKAQLKLVS